MLNLKKNLDIVVHQGFNYLFSVAPPVLCLVVNPIYDLIYFFTSNALDYRHRQSLYVNNGKDMLIKNNQMFPICFQFIYFYNRSFYW